MIYASYGIPVKIHGGNNESGKVEYELLNPRKTVVKEGHVCDLRADGGIAEIKAAIEAANKGGVK